MPKRQNPFLALAGVLKTAATRSFHKEAPSSLPANSEDINDRLRTFRHEAGEGGLFNGGAFAPGNDKFK